MWGTWKAKTKRRGRTNRRQRQPPKLGRPKVSRLGLVPWRFQSQGWSWRSTRTCCWWPHLSLGSCNGFGPVESCEVLQNSGHSKHSQTVSYQYVKPQFIFPGKFSGTLSRGSTVPPRFYQPSFCAWDALCTEKLGVSDSSPFCRKIGYIRSVPNDRCWF